MLHVETDSSCYKNLYQKLPQNAVQMNLSSWCERVNTTCALTLSLHSKKAQEWILVNKTLHNIEWKKILEY